MIFISPCFAMSNIEGMRILTINALLQYGQKLYERGDRYGATAVFHHILTVDAHQPKALRFLKEMGNLTPTAPSGPKTDIKTIYQMDTVSLKEAIEAKKQAIEDLKAQIGELRFHISGQEGNE